MIAAASLEATVVLVLLEDVAPLVIVTPFTFTLVTDVLPLPLTVMVAALAVDAVLTTGVNPAAPVGPLIVTTPPEALAV